MLDYSHFVIYSVSEVVKVRIQEIRKSKGIKQKELAAKLGIAANTLSQYETGNREPDLETIKRIAFALEVTVDELLDAKTKTRPQAGDGLQLGHLSEEELDYIKWYREKATEKEKEIVRLIVKGES